MGLRREDSFSGSLKLFLGKTKGLDENEQTGKWATEARPARNELLVAVLCVCVHFIKKSLEFYDCVRIMTANVCA